MCSRYSASRSAASPGVYPATRSRLVARSNSNSLNGSSSTVSGSAGAGSVGLMPVKSKPGISVMISLPWSAPDEEHDQAHDEQYDQYRLQHFPPLRGTGTRARGIQPRTYLYGSGE